MKANTKSISILIVDDHPIVRSGLEAMLQSEQGFRILGCASSGMEAVSLCQKAGQPDVLLMDIRMPEMDGFQTLERLKRFFPSIRVLLLAGMPLKAEEDRAKALGAKGYLPKSAEQDRIVEAIRAIAAGNGPFVQETYETPKSVLSDRETEVLKLLSGGKSREEIAAACGIGAETVKSHVKSILLKLDVPDRTAAVAKGFELGILRA